MSAVVYGGLLDTAELMIWCLGVVLLSLDQGRAVMVQVTSECAFGG